MSVIKEKALYPSIKTWLENLLKSNFPKKGVYTYNTSSIYLNNFIQDKNWISLCPEYVAYQIKIDILGVLIEKDKIDFILVEVKKTKISLKDISQLIGYSKVVRPLHSFILSPLWISDPVKILFESYRRYDILNFFENRKIKVCKWDTDKKDVDFIYIYPNKPLLEFIR